MKNLRVAIAVPFAWLGAFFTVIGDGFYRLADAIGGATPERFGDADYR